jgi:para-nitrobenzyl esterase
MRKLTFILSMLVIGASADADFPPWPSVSVDGELIVGQYVSGSPVLEFRGIPYAEPPVGELRWKAPQPLQTKQKQRDATEFTAACMQTMRILDWYRSLAEKFDAPADYYQDLEISEDCLYLNLWTPTFQKQARLPVMVWIHGGSNKSGWSYEPNYRGQVLAAHDVVVVTVGFRQGAFGFVSHPDLAGEDAVANFGLWDLVAALQWIQDNIENFGGDPDRVTLFGESAGGEVALALMFVEAASDLFHRAIMQSAAAYGMSMSDLESEQKRGAELAEAFGLEARGSLEELRSLPADELLQVYEANFGDYYHSPAIDGQLITESNWESVQAKRFGNHDLMIGTNDAEWLSYIDDDASVDDVVLTAANHPRIGGDKAFEMVKGEADPRRAMDRLITADAYVCPSQNIAAHRSASGGNAWVYFFTRAREDMGGKTIGAYHGAELPYVFGVHDSYMTTNAADLALTETMQEYWVNFARTGNPNGDDLPAWPLFERPAPLVQELGDEVRSIPAIEPEMCASFETWNESRNQ